MSSLSSHHSDNNWCLSLRRQKTSVNERCQTPELTKRSHWKTNLHVYTNHCVSLEGTPPAWRALSANSGFKRSGWRVGRLVRSGFLETRCYFPQGCTLTLPCANAAHRASMVTSCMGFRAWELWCQNWPLHINTWKRIVSQMNNNHYYYLFSHSETGKCVMKLWCF